MADLTQLLTDIGTTLANAESYVPNAADLDVNLIVSAYQAQKTKLSGSKATPQDFIDNGFALGYDIAGIFGNPKVTSLIKDLQTCESDAAKAAVFAELADLVRVYKDIKSLAGK